jgi:translation elongation factor EF-1beta
MQFINPFMLWGILAVVIPIIFHFWHQKRGQLLNWAATSWLVEKKLQPSKGIRLENILLLLLRCLLLIVLSFFLSKPLIKQLNINDLQKKIHLVQANNLVINNYKFELIEALKKGEKVFLINAETEQIKDFSNITFIPELNPLMFQKSINKIAQQSQNEQLELYFVNNADLTRISNIFVPNKFSLHTVIDSLNIPAKSYLEFSNKKKLFVNASNKLVSASELDKNAHFQAKPIHFGAIDINIESKNKAEKQVIDAALKALEDVYGIEVKTSARKGEGFLFPPLSIGEGLPERLAEIFIKKYNLNPSTNPLSQQQLKSLFRITEIRSKSNEESWFSKGFLLFFIIILGFERFFALKRNA